LNSRNLYSLLGITTVVIIIVVAFAVTSISNNPDTLESETGCIFPNTTSTMTYNVGTMPLCPNTSETQSTRLNSSSVLKEIIVQPVEIEISQNVSCGANLGSVCSTEPTVGCVDVSYGTTTETSYVFNGSTFVAGPRLNSTAFTTTLPSSSEITEIITTEACTHL